ncbi:MAG: GNAT family N-acetyltransferase [Candidatus Hodarchaeota archaeon]
MLIGNKTNLRALEREDLPMYAKWMNDPDFVGEFFIPMIRPVTSYEKYFSEPSPDSAVFIIEAKDGTPAGWIAHFMTRFGGYMTTKEIGYMLAPDHRKKGFATESVAIMLDYLFLGKEWQRIQAVIEEENIGSKRVLEKNGFKKEGVLRMIMYSMGGAQDCTIYSILREEWKGPKVLPYVVK